MTWTTSNDLLQWAADTLHTDIGALPAEWSRQAGNAVTIGYNRLVAYLAGLGYSAGQLAGTIDQSASWNLTQGLYEIAGLGGGFGNYERAWFDRFDLVTLWNEDKQKCVPLSNGFPLAPDGTSPFGPVLYGQVSAAATALQCLGDPFATGRAGWPYPQ